MTANPNLAANQKSLGKQGPSIDDTADINPSPQIIHL